MMIAGLLPFFLFGEERGEVSQNYKLRIRLGNNGKTHHKFSELCDRMRMHCLFIGLSFFFSWLTGCNAVVV